MSVTNQDLTHLLNVLYQGAVRKNPLAVPPAMANPAKFFRREDIETVANDYGFPLPADVDATLAVGLSRGVFQRSLEQGTECGAGLPCDPTVPEPILVYAYNPNMAKMNPRNQELLDPVALSYQRVSGTFVKFSNNRAPCYGTRGYAVWHPNPLSMPGTNRYQSTKCCSRS
jgi:hypothetical protein